MNKEIDVYNQKRGIPLQIGDVFETVDGCSVEVIEVINSGSCVIKFQDEYKHKMTVVSSNLRRGAVKNPWTKLTGGSYVGVGKYDNNSNKDSYVVWRNIVSRCYNTKSIGQLSGVYVGCTMSDEWLNFQNFCEWYENHPDFGKGWQVDKDIKYKDNKVYSSETCIMIPKDINLLFTKTRDSKLGYGVKIVKTSGKLYVNIAIRKNTFKLGYVNSSEDGDELAKFCKEEYIDLLTQTTYKDMLSEDVRYYMSRFRF